jgi:thiol-disulfide isomerase/thioredoxin
MQYLLHTFLAFVLALPASGIFAQQSAGHLSLKQLQEIYQQDNDTTYVVNFWATWCGPCVMEMPALVQFYHSHQNTNIRLLLISLDQPKQEKQVNNFIKKNNIPAPVYLLHAGKDFSWLPQVDPDWHGSIPATLIINRSKNTRLFREAPLQPGQLDFLLKKLGLN